jgi:prephenate dehydrogenase
MISASTSAGPRRAQVVGTGLVGGSVGLALRGLGWHVTGDEAPAGYPSGSKPIRRTVSG